jgi:trimeric autotransporter adhesin
MPTGPGRSFRRRRYRLVPVRPQCRPSADDDHRQDYSANRLSTLEFNSGIAPTDIIAKRVWDNGNNSLELAIAGTTDKVTVRAFFGGDDPNNIYNPVQQVRFADGTTWDMAGILAQVFAGTSGVDDITGTIGNDVINGQAGADWLKGRAGNDTLNGGEGNDTLEGEAGNDVLNGGAGNDTLNGGVGNNTYLFGHGDGQDLIAIGPDYAPNRLNTLEFKAGVLPSEVVVRRVWDNGQESLELSIAGTSHSVLARSFFRGNDPGGPYNPVQQVRFADNTVWDIPTLVLRSQMSGGGPEPLSGWETDLAVREAAIVASSAATPSEASAATLVHQHENNGT